MKVKIIRLETPKDVEISDQSQATIGVMLVDGKVFCYTLEPPWRGNGKDSCIPVGSYECKKYSSMKYPKSYEVLDVPKRTKILIHAGNIDDHSLGCILLGQSQGYFGGKRAVLNSRVAFNKFMDFMEGYNSFDLEIVEV